MGPAALSAELDDGHQASPSGRTPAWARHATVTGRRNPKVAIATSIWRRVANTRASHRPWSESGVTNGCAASAAKPQPFSVTTIDSSSSGRGLAIETKRSEEHTSELQSLMRISYAVFCLK